MFAANLPDGVNPVKHTRINATKTRTRASDNTERSEHPAWVRTHVHSVGVCLTGLVCLPHSRHDSPGNPRPQTVDHELVPESPRKPLLWSKHRLGVFREKLGNRGKGVYFEVVLRKVTRRSRRHRSSDTSSCGVKELLDACSRPMHFSHDVVLSTRYASTVIPPSLWAACSRDVRFPTSTCSTFLRLHHG